MDLLNPVYLILAGWTLLVAALYLLATRWRELSRARSRLGSGREDVARGVDAREVTEIGALERWLALAGFRAPGSPTTFVLAYVVCLLAALAVLLFLTGTSLIEGLLIRTLGLPPGVTDLLVPVLVFTPWVLALVLVLAPWLVVRGARQQRVLEIERELPILLDLLATLAESGLGFDAALAQVVESESEEHALLDELRQFQLESLAGVPRARCFRRLADRVRVGSMTIFCSAMIQADQVGAGFSSVLRQQADDLRNRRRERALILAQALPVKLVFPLVICFLPAIFLVTLGPAFHQFLQYADSMLSGR